MPDSPSLRSIIRGVIASSMPLLLAGCSQYHNTTYVVPTSDVSDCERVCSELVQTHLGDFPEGGVIVELNQCTGGIEYRAPTAGREYEQSSFEEPTMEIAADPPQVYAICRMVVYDPQPGGRRPQGLVQPGTLFTRHPAGALFAALAHVEEASVPAFIRLSEELAVHDAPRTLCDRAVGAAADEVRHAYTIGRWRDRFGGDPVPLEHAPLSLRPLEEVARENAVEGCVRETWGAIVAEVQGMCAQDPIVRRDLATIAADEARHAELARDVDRWAMERLGPQARRRVAAARARAHAELVAEARDAGHGAAERFVGTPDPDESVRLLEAARPWMTA